MHWATLVIILYCWVSLIAEFLDVLKLLLILLLLDEVVSNESHLLCFLLKGLTECELALRGKTLFGISFVFIDFIALILTFLHTFHKSVFKKTFDSIHFNLLFDIFSKAADMSCKLLLTTCCCLFHQLWYLREVSDVILQFILLLQNLLFSLILIVLTIQGYHSLARKLIAS